jgi:hypothetical protein
MPPQQNNGIVAAAAPCMAPSNTSKATRARTREQRCIGRKACVQHQKNPFPCIYRSRQGRPSQAPVLLAVFICERLS